MRSFISPSLLLIVKVPENQRTHSSSSNPDTSPQASASLLSNPGEKYTAPGTQSLS